MLKTGMFHRLRNGRERLYTFSGDHVDVVRDIRTEKQGGESNPHPIKETCIARTRKGDLAELTRIGNHWQRDAALVRLVQSRKAGNDNGME